MTTANLTVGVDTSKAKGALAELKKEMASLGGDLRLGVDKKALASSVRSALDAEKFEVRFSTSKFRDEIRGVLSTLKTDLKETLNAGFAGEHRITIDREHLIKQVREAVAIGLSGAKSVNSTMGPTTAAAAPVATAAAVGAGMTVDVKTVLAQSLNPVLEELSKAAALAGATTRAADGVTSSRVRASVGQSFKDNEGRTFRHAVSVPPEEALATITLGNEAAAEAAKAKADLADLQRSSNETFRARRAARRYEETEARTELADLQRSSNETFRARRAARRYEEAEAKTELVDLQRSSNETFRARRAARRFDETAAKAELAELQRSSNETFRARRTARRYEEAEAKTELAELQRSSNETFRARRAARLYEERAAKADERAQQQRATAAARQMQAELRNVQASAMFNARGAGYTAQGARIAGAAAVMAHNPQAGAAFLNNDALVRSIPLLEQHRKVIKAVAEDTTKVAPAAAKAAIDQRVLNRVMGDGHAAARGLAGSMGALWTTYGSIVPLVAAAAIGASLRKVFEVGKEVEFQLKFVSALADFTPVSTSKFADAVRGSMVAPTEAAQAMRGLAQNGLSVRESLQALPTILNLATAGEMSLSEAALSATGVMAAFGLTVNDLGRVSDVFTKAAAISNTSVREMTEAMKQASTVSDVYHVSIEETAAALAVMAQRNIRGTQAGTAYRNMWTELVTPSKKAQQSLKAVGLELFDGNKQLIDASKALDLLHGKLSTLNEQSRLTLLHDLFGKKGEKAANTLMNDYPELLRMREKIERESKDFSQSVVNALNETAGGKFRQLFTEFELAAVTSFERSSNSARNFADSLRLMVASPEFVNGLAYITSGLANLTQYLIEHKWVVLGTIGLWKGTGWALAAVESFRAIRKAAMEAGVAVSAFGLASRAAWAWATAGVSLIIGLGVEYLLLRDNTDAATEAQKAYNNALDAESERLDRSIEATRERNKSLLLQNKYLREGKGLSEARELADRDLEGNKVTSASQAAANTQIALGAERGRLIALRARIKEEEDRQRKRGPVGAFNEEFTSTGRLSAMQVEEKAQAAKVAGLEAAAAKEKRALEKARTDFEEKEIGRTRSFNNTRISEINKFNEDLKTSMKNDPRLKGKLTGLRIDETAAPTSKEEFDKFMADKKAEYNRNLHNNVAPDPRAAHQLDNAKVRDILARLRSEQAEVQQTIRFRRELDEARYSEKMFGPYVAATLAEQRTERETIELLNQQKKARQELTEAQKLPNLNEADKQRIKTDLDTYSEQIKAQERALAHVREMNALKAAEREREMNFNAASEARKLGVASDKRVEKIRQGYSTKVIDPASAAESNARLAEEEAYAEKISAHEQMREEIARHLSQTKERLLDLTGSDFEAALAAVGAAERQLSFQTDILNTLKAQRDARAGAAGRTAREEYQNSQTAEYGFNKYWQEFTAGAESSADQVRAVMKSTTTGMTGMFKGFTETGKLDFKSFAASIASTAAQMMVNKAIVQLLQIGMSFFGGSANAFGGANGKGFGSGAAFGNQDLGMNFERGGVMTSRGAVPLRRYDAGGVAYSPQLALYGEGKRPEAYVPLPDGRSIPVTMEGGGGGGSTQVNIAVHVDSNGGSRVESDSSGEKAAQLGQMIENATMAVIAREKRAGGLLYA